MPRKTKTSHTLQAGSTKQALTLQVLHNAARFSRTAASDELDAQLRFTSTVAATNAGANYNLLRYIPNGAYDVDPNLGSTSTAGFAELAAIYSYYRVVAYRVHLAMSNTESFPALWFAVHTNTDPGTTVVNNFVVGSGNAFGACGALASSGGPTSTYTSKLIRVTELVGGVDPETGDQWRGTSTSNPTDLIYFGIGFSGGFNTFTAGHGVLIAVQITMYCRFYDRKLLTS